MALKTLGADPLCDAFTQVKSNTSFNIILGIHLNQYRKVVRHQLPDFSIAFKEEAQIIFEAPAPFIFSPVCPGGKK